MFYLGLERKKKFPLRILFVVNWLILILKNKNREKRF